MFFFFCYWVWLCICGHRHEVQNKFYTEQMPPQFIQGHTLMQKNKNQIKNENKTPTYIKYIWWRVTRICRIQTKQGRETGQL